MAYLSLMHGLQQPDSRREVLGVGAHADLLFPFVAGVDGVPMLLGRNSKRNANWSGHDTTAIIGGGGCDEGGDDEVLLGLVDESDRLEVLELLRCASCRHEAFHHNRLLLELASESG